MISSASSLLSNCLAPSFYLIEIASLKSILEHIHCVLDYHWAEILQVELYGHMNIPVKKLSFT